MKLAKTDDGKTHRKSLAVIYILCPLIFADVTRGDSFSVSVVARNHPAFVRMGFFAVSHDNFTFFMMIGYRMTRARILAMSAAGVFGISSRNILMAALSVTSA